MILKINEITRHLDQDSYFYIMIVRIIIDRQVKLIIHDMSKSYSNRTEIELSLIYAGGFFMFTFV